jgi:hypothetical protein
MGEVHRSKIRVHGSSETGNKERRGTGGTIGGTARTQQYLEAFRRDSGRQ